MTASPSWLFCIGAQKAGTTWLYDYCQAHPDIHVPAIKEMHYFNARFDPRQIGFANNRRALLEAKRASVLPEPRLGAALGEPGDNYTAEVLERLVAMHDDPGDDHALYRDFMMNGYAGQTCVADITPDYAVMHYDVFRRMATEFDGARLLFIMRDPLERTWSAIKMHRKFLASQGLPQHSEDALLDQLTQNRQRHIKLRSYYQRTLFGLNRAARADQLLYLFYEDLFCDDTIRRLCDFLGVAFVPGKYGRRVRLGERADMTGAQREKLLRLLHPVYDLLSRAPNLIVPDSWNTAAALALEPLELPEPAPAEGHV